MAKSGSIYRKVTRKHRVLLGYSQVWLADDHLLLLKSTRLAEEYRRFALADIQALVITEVPNRQVLDFIALLGALLWTALAATFSSRFGQGFFVVTGAGFAALAIANLARGSRCNCHLYTAVSKELLTPVRRMRVARRFLARVQPAIEAVQGTLSVGDAAFLERSPVVPSPPSIPEARGHVTELLFGLILLDAILIPLSRRFPRLGEQGSMVVLGMTFITEVALAIVVLSRSHSGVSTLRQMARYLAGVALICMLADLVGVGSSVVGWFQQVAVMAQRRDPNPPTFNWPVTAAWLYFAVGWRVVVGLTGLGTTLSPEPVRQVPEPEKEGADERAA